MPGIEKKSGKIEKGQKISRESMLNHILELSVPKILENSRGRDITMADLVPVLNDVIEQLRTSDTTKKTLGLIDHGSWDRFFDEILDAVWKKVEDEKKNEVLSDPAPIDH